MNSSCALLKIEEITSEFLKVYGVKFTVDNERNLIFRAPPKVQDVVLQGVLEGIKDDAELVSKLDCMDLETPPGKLVRTGRPPVILYSHTHSYLSEPFRFGACGLFRFGCLFCHLPVVSFGCPSANSRCIKWQDACTNAQVSFARHGYKGRT